MRKRSGCDFLSPDEKDSFFLPLRGSKVIKIVGGLLLGDFLVGGGVFAWRDALRTVLPPFLVAPAMWTGTILIALSLMVCGLLIYLYRKHNYDLEKEMYRILSHVLGRKAQKGITDSLNEICGYIAHYYKTLLGQESIACAVRVAVNGSDGSILYRTVGRAGLSPGREEKSEDVRHDQGVFRILNEKRTSGAPSSLVLTINNRAKAIVEGALFLTKNEVAFPDDYLAALVVPVYSRTSSGDSPILLGTLHITAKKDIFRDRHFYVSQIFAIILSDLLQDMYGTSADSPQAGGCDRQ